MRKNVRLSLTWALEYRTESQGDNKVSELVIMCQAISAQIEDWRVVHN